MIKDPLLRFGYFPKELPSCFSTEQFANAVKKNSPPKEFYLQDRKRPLQAHLAKHNLTRPGLVKRPLSIPNPANYHQIVELLNQNWPMLVKHFAKTKNSLSTPELDTNQNRAIGGKYLRGSSYSQSAKIRAGMRYLVTADVQSCYASIYTHSIPWALHGKKQSKSNRRYTWSPKGGLWGNDLDAAIRNSQDGQTIGLPIGPDTSLVIWEMLGSVIDVELAKKSPKFLRRIDDFEIAVSSLTEAESAISDLEEILSKFDLQLNPKKTSITPLPLPINYFWLHSVRDFSIDNKTSSRQSKSIEKYFQILFEAKNKNSAAHMLSYSLRRFLFEKIEPQNAPLLHNLLWQCVAAEPSSARFALAIFEKHKLDGLPVDLDLLQECLCRLLKTSLPTSRGNELAWSLWGLLLFDQKIDTVLGSSLGLLKDPFALILAVDADRRKLCSFSKGEISKLMKADELSGAMWPFVYEVGVRKWLANDVKFIENDNVFGYLRSNRVRFYEPFSTLSGKSIRKKKEVKSKPSSNLRKLLRSDVGGEYGLV